MSSEQAVMILTFIAGTANLIAQSQIGAPFAPILTLVASVVMLGVSIFFGAKVAAGSQRVQALLLRTGLKKA